MNKYLAEFLGTFAIVLFGTGAIVVNAQFPGTIGHMGISLAFGAIVTISIYLFGQISGAHFNPAVTISLAADKRFEKNLVLPYLLAQFSGGIAASFLLAALFTENETLGATLPSVNVIPCFLLELFLTFFLMLTIFSFEDGQQDKKKFAGIVIGILIFLEALCAGPLTGASMNPARSLAPALVSGHTEHLWVYLSAPVAGSLLAIVVWRFFRHGKFNP